MVLENKLRENFTCEGKPYNPCGHNVLGKVLCNFYNNGDCLKMYVDKIADVEIIYDNRFNPDYMRISE